MQIDLEGIQERIIAFPVSEGRYGRVLGAQDGKVLYNRYPLQGALDRASQSNGPRADGLLLSYNFDEQKEETLVFRLDQLSTFPLTGERSSIAQATRCGW